MHVRCRTRVSAVSGGLLEGSHLSEKNLLLLMYFWAHDCAGTRAEEMLGHGSKAVAEWSARFRQCVLNEQVSRGVVLGGRDMEVEVDETEIGRRRKGLHVHESQVIADVRGVFERSTGKIFLETYEKLQADSDERRFGPPNKAEASDLFGHVAAGSIVFADSARAYLSAAASHGVLLRCVNHGKGEYVRREHLRGCLRCVSTQGIDGTWGRLKMWFSSKGGIPSDHVLAYLKEFQWRANYSDCDLFVKLCEHIRDGFFQ